MTGPNRCSGPRSLIANVCSRTPVASRAIPVLGYISLVAGAGAQIAGALSWRRHGPSVRAAAGMAMAAVSIYVILLEIFVVG